MGGLLNPGKLAAAGRLIAYAQSLKEDIARHGREEPIGGQGAALAAAYDAPCSAEGYFIALGKLLGDLRQAVRALQTAEDAA